MRGNEETVAATDRGNNELQSVSDGLLFHTAAKGGYYSRTEAWLYDRIAQPSVVRWNELLWESDLQHLPQGARVLDVGCGGGQLPVLLAERRPDLSITGVDISPVQVKRARKRCARFGERISILEGDALNMPVDSGAYDAVVSILVLKHFPEPDKAVAEFLRAAKPGAAVLMAEVERGRPLHIARNFVAGMALPFWMKPFALPMFYTFVTGQGPTLEEARAWWRNQGVEGAETGRLPELPAVVLRGIKPRQDPVARQSGS